MFCALFGLSPCDVILNDIDIQTVKELIQALNNRFDMEALIQVKAEFQYVADILTNSLIYDYENREDRVLAKKMGAATMNSFGDFGASQDKWQIERQLQNAKKVFTGKVKTKQGVILVRSQKAKMILETLHEKRNFIQSISNSIGNASFDESVFFGKPVVWWATMNNHNWLTSLVETRIKAQDDIERMVLDAKKLLRYVNREEDIQEDLFGHEFTLEYLQKQYHLVGGGFFTLKQVKLSEQFCEKMQTLEQNRLKPSISDAILKSFLYCLKFAEDFETEIAEDLEQCGLYFMNPVRAEIMLEYLSNFTLIPEKKLCLCDPEFGDGYETILNAVISAGENDSTLIGDYLLEAK